MSPSERVFRAMLRLYPAAFRRRFGGEMVEMFAVRRQAVRSASAWVALWAGVLIDTVSSAFASVSQ